MKIETIMLKLVLEKLYSNELIFMDSLDTPVYKLSRKHSVLRLIKQ